MWQFHACTALPAAICMLTCGVQHSQVCRKHGWHRLLQVVLAGCFVHKHLLDVQAICMQACTAWLSACHAALCDMHSLNDALC